MVLQALFAYRQLSMVYQKLEQVKQMHAGAGYLAMGNAKPKIPFGKGVAVILVLSEEGRVADYYEMRGMTVFARFRRRAELVGLPVDVVAGRMKEKNGLSAFNRAVSLIEAQRSQQTALA